jgi:hypothetical protein
MAYHLPLEITHEEHLWMARSPAVPGLLVTGDTIPQLLGELPVVAQVLFQACREKGWAFVKDAPGADLSEIVWLLELPHPLLQAA